MTTPHLDTLPPEQRLKVLARIKKLHDKAQSAAEIGSQAEAETFAEAVSKMLAMYNLELTDIEYELASADDPMTTYLYDFVKEKVDPNESLKHAHRIEALELLAGAIASSNSCYRYFGQTRTTEHPWSHWTVTFVGRKSAIEATIYMMTNLSHAMYQLGAKDYGRYVKLCKQDGEKPARGFYESWQKGFVHAIATRLYKVQQEIKVETARAGNSKALVRLTNQLKDAKDHAEKITNLRSMGNNRGGKVNHDGGAMGRTAGAGVTIIKGGLGGNSQAGQKRLGK